MWIAFIYTNARLKHEAKFDTKMSNDTDKRATLKVTTKRHPAVVSMKYHK